jgi:hypothetical protein
MAAKLLDGVEGSLAGGDWAAERAEHPDRQERMGQDAPDHQEGREAPLTRVGRQARVARDTPEDLAGLGLGDAQGAEQDPSSNGVSQRRADVGIDAPAGFDQRRELGRPADLKPKLSAEAGAKASDGSDARRCQGSKHALGDVEREVDAEVLVVSPGAGRKWVKGSDRASLQQPELAYRIESPLEVLR